MVVYEDRTIKDLKSLAKNNRIKGYSLCSTKKDLISLLRKEIRSCKKLLFKKIPIKDHKCTKRNPEPPCQEGYFTKYNPKGELCCYKSPKKIPIKVRKYDKKIITPTTVVQRKCTKRNPEPPCQKGYGTKYNPKGELCCYKSPKKKIITPIITPTTVIQDQNILYRKDIFFSNISCNNFKKYYEKYMSKILGTGTYGKVYEYCIPKNAKNIRSEFNCDYALKIINNVSEKEFKDELQISKIAGDNRIGPKIYKGILCNKTGMIFMEKLEGIEFLKYIQKALPNNLNEVKKVTENIFKKIKDLHKLGYVHLDTHGGNIWVNKDKSVYLLDYGFAEESTYKLDRFDDYRLFKNDVISIDVVHLMKKYKNKPKELSNIVDYKKYVMKMYEEYTKNYNIYRF